MFAACILFLALELRMTGETGRAVEGKMTALETHIQGRAEPRRPPELHALNTAQQNTAAADALHGVRHPGPLTPSAWRQTAAAPAARPAPAAPAAAPGSPCARAWPWPCGSWVGMKSGRRRCRGQVQVVGACHGAETLHPCTQLRARRPCSAAMPPPAAGSRAHAPPQAPRPRPAASAAVHVPSPAAGARAPPRTSSPTFRKPWPHCG